MCSARNDWILTVSLIPDFLDAYSRDVSKRDFNVVGLTCTFNQTLPSLALARRLKQISLQLTIVLGGACVHDGMGDAHARGFPGIIDYVFTGESDATLPAFLEALSHGREPNSLPGIVNAYTTSHDADPDPLSSLDGLPLPDYEGYFRERARLSSAGFELPEVHSLPFEASRGSWWPKKASAAKFKEAMATSK